jgi:hypothetical protein
MPMTRVLIHGPNLTDQSKGQFHVHHADCGDNHKYGFDGRLGGEDAGMPVEVSTREAVVRYVYEDQMAENPDHPFDVYRDDFHFAPCVRDLPEE